MKINRTQNATKNITVGFVFKIYQMILPFIMRTIMIYYLGVQYLGLNSLFASILQVLNLAELGVGNAMVFSMYKPIAEDDRDTICALMKLYRHYYRIIGIVIGIAGIILTPFIPNLIKGKTIPGDMNVYILYLLNLGATVLSYWLFAYKNSLLQAHQRTDVGHLVLIGTNTLQYALQIFAVIVLKNYYIYVVIILLCQVLSNIMTAIIVDRMYPDYCPYGEIETDKKNAINSRIKDLFTSKLGAVITGSADAIVISAFLGLEMLAIYQNYYYILTSIIALVEITFSSILAGLGNSFVVETREKNFENLQKLTFMLMWLVCICSCCFLGLFQPFMEIWVGKELMLSMGCVVCFVVYYYIYELNRIVNVFKDAAGLWHKDRFRPLITGLVNLGINLILVNYWGLYGVLLSTVFSIMFVGIPWLFYNLFTNLFEMDSMSSYLKNVILYMVLALISGGITYFICNCINLGRISTLIVRLVICLIIPNVIYILVANKRIEFYQSIEILDRMTRGKLNLDRIYRKVVNVGDLKDE